MTTINSIFGTTHEIEQGGMPVFGLNAFITDTMAEERGEKVRVVFMDLGHSAVSGAMSKNPALPPDSNH